MISISTFNRWAAGAAAVALVIVTGYSAADLTWKLLYDAGLESPPGPITPPPAPRAPGRSGDYAQAAALHLFGEAQSAAPQAESRAAAEAPKTRLQLTLRGVFLADEPSAAVAIIADDQDRERPYRIGDAIADAAVVKQILPQRVLLDRNGALEALDLPKERLQAAAPAKDPPAAAAPPQAKVAPRRSVAAKPRTTESVTESVTVDASLRRDFASVVRQVRFQPVAENGALKGYRLTPKGDGDGRLLRQAGLAPGDLVTRVNGIPITQPDGLAELMRQLDEREHFVLEVEDDSGLRQVNVRLD